MPRLLAGLLLCIPVLFHREFCEAFRYYLPNNLDLAFVEGSWTLVIAHVLVFVAFLIPLSFRRKANWGEYGLVGAFFVSLFVEMFGIPLSIMFLYRHLGLDPIRARPDCVLEFNLLGTGLCVDHLIAYGALLMVLGALLIASAWITLFRQSRDSPIVTRGIYGYSRHPQYLGFIMVIVGWLIGWPSLITFVFVPILVYKYISVCLTEEAEMSARFPAYESYRRSVPFFL